MDDETRPYQDQLAKRLLARAEELRGARDNAGSSADASEEDPDGEAARRNED